MSIILYTKDITPRTKFQNNKTIEEYYKVNKKRFIGDAIFIKIGHKICIKFNNERFWMKTGY